jgi:hypothetical protein
MHIDWHSWLSNSVRFETHEARACELGKRPVSDRASMQAAISNIDCKVCYVHIYASCQRAVDPDAFVNFSEFQVQSESP